MIGASILLILLVTGLILYAAEQRASNKVDQAGTPSKLRGFTLSPKDYSASGFTDFFDRIAGSADIISWHGPWEDLSATGGAGNMIAANAKKYDYVPLTIVHNSKPDNAGLKTPFNEATKADYTKRAVDFVTKYKPRYFGIGIEINRMAVKSPQDVVSYTAFYPTVVQAIKAASPDTQIVTTFELNTMKGLNGS